MPSLGGGIAVIVCGTDLSERSLPAQEAAAALAGRLGGRELWLAYVLDASSRLFDARMRHDVENAAKAELSRSADQAKRSAGLDVNASVLLHADKPAQPASELIAFAEERGASLLVVSSQGHGATPLLRLGGTSERVASSAHLPVLVVRDAKPFTAWARGERALRVLVGVDRGAASAAAVAWVKELQAAGPCEVLVTEVYYLDDAARRYGIPRKAPLTREDPELEQLLVRDLAARFGQWPHPGHVSYHAELGLGRLGDHLLGAAENHGADLIVVGNHPGRGKNRLRSVSSVVLHHGHASVACVPATGLRPFAVPQLRSVLVATDLSAEGNHAVAYAYALCHGAGEVHLLHVVSDGGAASEIELARRLRALVPEEGAEIATRTLIVQHRNVARAICEASERLGVDAVCLSSSTKKGLSRALGSVAAGVVQEGRRPTLLVRPPMP